MSRKSADEKPEQVLEDPKKGEAEFKPPAELPPATVYEVLEPIEHGGTLYGSGGSVVLTPAEAAVHGERVKADAGG
ncbi:MAG: hypothetical protein MH252_08475 [Thermosynechococcaceae cyanobacterium MS004]|nr:hypothetical protein [Thermosynechococcaceae cyanobacterium MS004]